MSENRRISSQYGHLRLVCAPYLALRVLRLTFDERSRYPEAADIVLNKMYVDDVLSGADMISQALAKAGQLDRLLMVGGFRLHKWTSNESHVLAGIDSNHCVDMNPREFQSQFFVRALGLSWNLYEDVFVLQPRFTNSSSILTKLLQFSHKLLSSSALSDFAHLDSGEDFHPGTVEA